MGTSVNLPVPALLTCLCVNCSFKGSARGTDSLIEVAKDHGVWCARQREHAAQAEHKPDAAR